MLTHNRINTYLVLIFSASNKDQIYSLTYRESPHYEIEILMSFDYSKVFNTNENKYFLFQIEDEEYIYAGEKVIKFKTDDKVVNYFSKEGFNDIHYG